MLELPTVGMLRSVSNHNVNVTALCDWIESSVLFLGEEVAKSDVIDVLTEQGIYDKQDFASQIVDAAWVQLRRRQRWMGQATPIKVVGETVMPLRSWQRSPAHSFCLALALVQWYPQWARQFGSNYTVQGELFEALTKASLERLFPGWIVHQTGWRRSHASNIKTIVQEVANRLDEEMGNIDRWTSQDAHEAGLDLLCYRPYDDGRVGVPVFLIQCASGQDWDSKLDTPKLKTWAKIVDFASTPKKAFAMPCTLEDKEFTRKCNDNDGMLMDRYRLLAAGRVRPNWISRQLKADILAWLKPRVKVLPLADG